MPKTRQNTDMKKQSISKTQTQTKHRYETDTGNSICVNLIISKLFPSSLCKLDCRIAFEGGVRVRVRVRVGLGLGLGLGLSNQKKEGRGKG
jgi:hypothetical protein